MPSSRIRLVNPRSQVVADVSSLLDRGPAASPSLAPPTAKARLPVRTRSRRSVLTMASIVVVCASIAIFAEAYASANHETAAIVVTETIQQGQLILGRDLGQASVAVTGGVAPIPVSDASELSGKRAAVTIPAGSLLVTGDVTEAPSIAAGDAVVGMALKAGQLPAAGVEPGDHVMIVETGPSGPPSDSSASGDASSVDPGSSTGVLVPEASVFDVDSPSADSSSGTSELVSVEVAGTLAAAVTTAAAAGQASLALLAPPPASQGNGSAGSGQGGGSGDSSLSGGNP